MSRSRSVAVFSVLALVLVAGVFFRSRGAGSPTVPTAKGRDADVDTHPAASLVTPSHAMPLTTPSATSPILPELLPMSAPPDINHVLTTGQSLSVGWVGHPPLSRRQPYANLMFSNGVIPGGKGLSAFAPLIEGTVDGGTSPDVETMSSGFANLVARMARDYSTPQAQVRHDLLVSAHGVSGTPYAGLKKGTEAYANGIAQVGAALTIAGANGKSYIVRAVTNVHGEADHVARNSAYVRDLLQWQSDYERDVTAITQQTKPVPMFHTQMSSFTIYGSATSAIPQAQLQAHLESNGKIVLVGPKYHLEYAGDGLHLTNEGYRHMGEDYAKVYRRVILEGRPWEPLRPTAVRRAKNIITVKFVVPAPPIVLDEKLIANPGDFGFEYSDDDRSASIASVRVTGPDTIELTLSAEPTGANKRLRYAFTGTPNVAAGPKTGARGNLRDSERAASEHGYSLYNWCVHFDEAVP
jgi:hypothetical protein